MNARVYIDGGTYEGRNGIVISPPFLWNGTVYFAVVPEAGMMESDDDMEPVIIPAAWVVF